MDIFIKDKSFYKRAIGLAIPITLQKVLTSLLSIVDTFVIGYIGEKALAAVTLANIPLNVVQMFLFGAQSGTSILISQYYGKRDFESVNKVLGVALWTVFVVTFAFSIIFIFFPIQFLSLFSNDIEIVELTVNYARLCSFAYVMNALSLVYISALSAMEQIKVGTYVLTTSMIIKIVLSMLFILVFDLGIVGAGLATIVSRIIEFGLCLYHMFKNNYFEFEIPVILSPGGEMVVKYFKSAGTVMINETIWGSGISAITNVLSHMENSAYILSAYSVASTTQSIITSLSAGFSNTTAIMVGIAVGADKSKDEIKKTAYTLITLSLLVGSSFGLLLFIINALFGYSFIYPMFNLSEVSSNYCNTMTIINSILLPFRTFNNCIVVGVLRGAGDVKLAALIDVLPLWLGAVPYAYITGLFLKCSIGVVFLAYLVQYIIQSIFGIGRMLKGDWIKNLTN